MRVLGFRRLDGSCWRRPCRHGGHLVSKVLASLTGPLEGVLWTFYAALRAAVTYGRAGGQVFQGSGHGARQAQGSGHSDGCEVAVKRLTCMNTVDTAWFTIHSLL
jgi:hypothetical protein